jgi:hypothetical protein
MTHRSTSRWVSATHPTCWRPANVVCPHRSPGTCSRAPRPTPLPSAGNWVRFFCSVPPLFVLNHSMPMANTTGKLASCCAFLSPLALSLRVHWPQFSRHSPLPSTTLPRWLLPATERPIAKNQTGPISRSGSSISVCHRTRRLLRTKSFVPPLAAAHPLTVLSWPRRSTSVASGVPARWP